MKWPLPQTLQRGWLHTHMLAHKRLWWRPLVRQTHYPQTVQLELLKRILRNQEDTEFGKKHHFNTIRSYHEFRLGVPIQTYEGLLPYIKEQEETKTTQMTMEQPVNYAMTSGTTGKPKFIPILPQTMQNIQRHQVLSTYAQYRTMPSIFEGKMLVIAGKANEGCLETGTPYGSMSGLLAAGMPSVLKHKLLLPEAVQKIDTYEEKYLHIAAWALAEPDVSVMATANPSTLLKLVEVGRQHFSKLLEMLSNPDKAPQNGNGLLPSPTWERMQHLQALLGHEDQLTLKALWPNLQAIVTWTGGNCGVLIPKLRSLLSKKTAIVEMGYLSSECIGSLNVDLRTNRCIPTFQDNFFEFVEQAEWDTGHSTVLTLEQLEKGKKYYVLVTTSSGLYRYFMNDLIEVTGWVNQTPSIQFVQKGKGVTNLTGEKLYEWQLIEAMQEIQKTYQTTIDFYMMLADPGTLQYTLYLEHPQLDHFSAYKMEQFLSQHNVEYQAKLKSDRLQPIRMVYLKPGTAEAYKAHCLQQGQREAQFKLVKLQSTKDCSFDFMRHVRV